MDDHPVTRTGVAALLSGEPDFEVCGQCESVSEGLKLTKGLHPDLVIVDIVLKSGSGIELVRALKVSRPELPVLVMSLHDEIIYAERAIRAGARGYLAKQEASSSLVGAARKALGKELYLSEKMREKMLRRIMKKKPGEEMTFPIDTLSEREMEVFLLIGKGVSTRSIAESLTLSVKTIDTYREHLKTKLHLQNSEELVYHAIQWGKSEGVFRETFDHDAPTP